MTYPRGLDLSAYQVIPDPLSWLAAAREFGVAFCYLKASEGNGNRSTVYASRQEACRALNLRSGPYHFAHPDALACDPIREAALCHEVAGPWQPGDLPPALDLEEAPIQMPASEIVAWALAWLQETERLSARQPVLYTGPGFWAGRLGRTRALSQYDLWTAQYPDESRPVEPVRGRNPAIMAWRTWSIWQWTGHGAIPFYRGALDLNVYRGTIDDLDRWCGLEVT